MSVETDSLMQALKEAGKKYRAKKKKLPVATQRNVDKLLQKKMIKKQPGKLRYFLDSVNYIPHQDQVYELLDQFVQGLSTREEDLQKWVQNISNGLFKLLGKIHCYMICQLMTTAMREFGNKSPSERYVQKLLPSEYKEEYRRENALKSSRTSAANNRKSLVEKSPSPKAIDKYSLAEFDTVTNIETMRNIAKYWYHRYWE